MNVLQNRKDSIKSAAKSAVDLFTKAVTSLEKVNAQAIALATENEVKITALQTDNNELNVVVKKNQKIIQNITKILED